MYKKLNLSAVQNIVFAKNITAISKINKNFKHIKSYK